MPSSEKRFLAKLLFIIVAGALILLRMQLWFNILINAKVGCTVDAPKVES